MAHTTSIEMQSPRLKEGRTHVARAWSDEDKDEFTPRRRPVHHHTQSTDSDSLRRLFSFAQLLAFALTFMSSWEVMAMNMGATFYNGGPQTLVWGIILVIIGALSQALSMAELATIHPIAGAQYHWTHFLAPERQKRFITWMQGWVTWFAWVSALAGSTSSEANILLGLVGTNYPSYEFQSWHVTMLIMAQLVLVGLINMYAFRIVPWLELVAGCMHVILWVIFVIVLVTLAPRHNADFVFFERSVSSGWDNSFVSWNLGLLVPAWGFIGFDGVVHMSEEVRKAKKAVPRAMIWTIMLNGTLAYGIIIVLLFCMGEWSFFPSILAGVANTSRQHGRCLDIFLPYHPNLLQRGRSTRRHSYGCGASHRHLLRRGGISGLSQPYHMGLGSRRRSPDLVCSNPSQAPRAYSLSMASDRHCLDSVVIRRRQRRDVDRLLGFYFTVITWPLQLLHHCHFMHAARSRHRQDIGQSSSSSAVWRLAIA